MTLLPTTSSPTGSATTRVAPLAAWSRRVIAALLDDVVLGATTFLAIAVQPVTAPSLAPVLEAAGTSGPFAWWTSPVVVAVLLALLAGQAWYGVTPGKLVTGIALVDPDTGRPPGLRRVLLRWAAHLLDAILLLGYLRPLWHARRQTIADTLTGTVVVHGMTAGPHPFALRSRAGRALSGREPRAVALVLCVAALPWSGALGSSGTAGSAGASCTPADGGSTPGAPRLTGGTLGLEPVARTTTRWGVTRQVVADGDDAVRAEWLLEGDVPQDATLRLELVAVDGGVRVVDHALRDGVLRPGEGRPADDMSHAVLLAPAVLDERGPLRGWTMTVLTDAGPSARCTGSAPA